MAVEPKTLGRYQLGEVIGKGAMGIVYEARDPKLNRRVAIKTILINQFDEETLKDFSMRFEREAHAAARLNHPNIVQVYDFGEESGVAYFVMEFIKDKKDLKLALATNQAFDRDETVRIMCELLDALDFAHESGVIHRDIKPANVMLDSQGRAKLADFGVARITDADRTSAERTQAGTVVGTPAYMSPEQLQGQRIDRRTDIFSAGVILYQFLTGQKPFTGEGAWTVAKKIIQDEPPMPSSINMAVSPEFDRVVAKALAKNPDQRFATAREFAAALRRAAEGKPAIQEAEPTVVVAREPPVSQATHPEALRSGEMELEFWRSIKDSDDPNDFELYVRQFPQGVYASLAGRKIAKLRSGAPADDSGTRTMAGADRTRIQRSVLRAETEPAEKREAGESAQPAVEKTVKLASAAPPAPTSQKKSLLVPGILGALILSGAAAYFFVVKPSQQSAAQKVEAEAKAGRDAAEAAKAEAQAKRAAQVQAQREAEAQAQRETQAKRDAEAQAKREAEAQAQRAAELKARREAEVKAQRAGEAQAQREAEVQAKREAEAQARREAETKAKREADAKAQREADLRAKRDAEEKAQREARAQREADEKAQREVKAKAQRDAEGKAKLAAESSLWDSIKSSSKPADFQKYLNRYPNGQYVEPARKRLFELESARLEETAKKQKDAEKKKSTVIVPPTF